MVSEFPFLYRFTVLFWEPPDVGPAPTGVWRVPPPCPIAIGGPFPQAKALPSPPSPSPLPPTPLALFAMLRGSGTERPSLVWGEESQGGWRGRGLQRYLGPDPHLGVLDFCILAVPILSGLSFGLGFLISYGDEGGSRTVNIQAGLAFRAELKVTHLR